MAEYENSHIWSQNGTDFRVYKPLRKTQETTSATGGICLAFQKSAKTATAISSSSDVVISREKEVENVENIVQVQKLDNNCKQQKTSPDSEEPNTLPIRLDFQGKVYLWSAVNWPIFLARASLALLGIVIFSVSGFMFFCYVVPAVSCSFAM